MLPAILSFLPFITLAWFSRKKGADEEEGESMLPEAASLRAAQRHELRPLRDYTVRFFGEEVSDLDTMEIWWDRNPTIFQILLTEGSPVTAESIRGYYCLLPITEAAADRLETGEYTAATLPAECIVGPGTVVSHLYIGGIAAGRARDREAVSIILTNALQALPDGAVIYARAVTQLGLTFLINRKFRRADGRPEQQIGALYRTVKENASTPSASKGQRKRLQRIRKSTEEDRLKPKTLHFQTCFGVFQGGGCRAAAYVGAYGEAVAHGVHFNEVAGTSAGAIVAVLIAAGANPYELRDIIKRLEFPELIREHETVEKNLGWRLRAAISAFAAAVKPLNNSLLDQVPAMLLHNGRYSSRGISEWLEGELQKLIGLEKNETVRFKHLKIPATVVATDLKDGEVKIWSSHENLEEPVTDIAVRASCSIPIFFQPVADRYVDGGVLSNLPAFIFSNGQARNRPSLPVLAFTLRADPDEAGLKDVFGLPKLLSDTIIDGSQKLQLDMQPRISVITIETGKIKATDFNTLTRDGVQKLVKNGVAAVRDFFASEVANLHEHNSGQLLSHNRYETLSLLVDRFATAKTVLVSCADLAWVDELWNSLLESVSRGATLTIITPKTSANGDWHRERSFLQTLGALIIEVPTPTVQAFVFDEVQLNCATALVLNVDRVATDAVELRGPSNFNVIRCITATLRAQIPATSAMGPAMRKPVLKPCAFDEIQTRLRHLHQYTTANITLERLTLGSLRSLKQFVPEHRYKQVQALARVYLSANGRRPELRVFAPAKWAAAGSLGMVAPPVVERHGNDYLLIDGTARALYYEHRGMRDMECVLIEGVQHALFSDYRLDLRSVRILSCAFSVHESCRNFSEEYVRDVHSVLRAP